MKFKNRSGVVLLLTLWVLIFLTIISSTFIRLVRFETKITGYQQAENQALTIARAGFEVAKYNLLEDKSEYDEPQAGWRILYEDKEANGNDKNDKVREPKRFLYKVKEDVNGYYTLRIEDEERKFNLNGNWEEKFKESVLKAVLKEMGVKEPDPVVDSILDWLDTDDLHRINGAEDSYYQALKNPYHCKNGPLDTIEELLLVKDVTPDLLSGLSEFITIYPYSLEAKININTVSQILLKAALADVPESLVNDIWNFRIGPDGMEGSDDDQSFKSVEEINLLPSWVGYPNRETGNKEFDIKNFFKVKSSIFRIESVGILSSGKVKQKLTVILEKSSDQARILYWKEG